MKIKALDKTHLMVILSQNETDSLGLHPELSWQNFHTKFVASRIFDAACRYCDFTATGDKIHLMISMYEENTVFLYCTAKKDRFKLSGTCKCLLFEFSDIDSLIDCLRILKKEDENDLFSLINYKDKYFLSVNTNYTKLHCMIRKISEYSKYLGKNPAMNKKIIEHGEFVFSGKPIKTLF